MLLRGKKTLVRYGILLGILFLSACIFPLLNSSLEEGYRAGGTVESLREVFVSSGGASSKDVVFYNINLGFFDRLAENTEQSIVELEVAKNAMEEFSAISVSGVVSSSLINENIQKYNGTSVDRILVHELQALNYLAVGNLTNARVEVLQADVLMKSFKKKKEEPGLASTRMLGGMIFEFIEEYDSALISYRKALNILDQNKSPPPPLLVERMVVLTGRLGLRSERLALQNRFGIERQNDSRQKLWIFDWAGFISVLRASKESYLAEDGLYYTISLPFYDETWQKPQPADGVDSKGERIESALLENLDVRVREDLQSRRLVNIAKAIARTQARKALNAQSEESSNHQSLLNITAFLLDIFDFADVRSWKTLPSEIRVMSLADEAGVYKVNWGVGGFTQDITVNEAETLLVVLHSFSPNPLIYRKKLGS